MQEHGDAWQARGPHPVGVTTIQVDVRDDRGLPVEIWYPAEESHRGQDVDPEGGDEFDVIPGIVGDVQQAMRDAAPATGTAFPAVVFSHGTVSHRRQSTFLCTHLASH